MDLTKLPLFAMMTRRMAWLNQRQQVLAQNVANADTPNYKPRDVKPLDFGGLLRRQLSSVRPQATSAAHLAGRRAEPAVRTEVVKPTVETTLSGNSVVLEEELMKASQTAMDYETTINLYRKHVNMIRQVLGRTES